MEWVCSKILITTSIQHAYKVHWNSYIDKALIVYKYLQQIVMQHSRDYEISEYFCSISDKSFIY